MLREAECNAVDGAVAVAVHVVVVIVVAAVVWEGVEARDGREQMH